LPVSFKKTIERQGLVSYSTAAEMQTTWKVQRAVWHLWNLFSAKAFALLR